MAGALALLADSSGCKSSGEGVACDPPVNPTCPGVSPSFANDVYPNVIRPFCALPCHSSIGQEFSMPLTTYQQIYGQNGQEAGEIFTQVFEDCLMPPSNAPAQLTDGDGDAGTGDAAAGTADAAATNPRQTLLDWLVCGALNN
ncbi:MAG TPA: hypothetical protein VFG23_11635 [Polyangia bacterium]|nr:hypothetical protein [Polyangia bacterium]